MIKKELGMTKDDSDTLRDKYMEALQGKTVPEEVGGCLAACSCLAGSVGVASISCVRVGASCD
jgi:hypothetical protein